MANVNPFGDEIFKHVTLAIDLNFMLKRSQLFAEKLYPGCLLIDVDELAEFADESDLEDIFEGEIPGEYDGLDLSDRDLKNKSKRSRRKSKELDLLKKATKLEGGSSRNKMAWDRAQSYASDPLILLVETHKDLNPFEIYSFLEEYTKDMDDYRSEYARYRRADGRYELLKVGSLLLRILRMHNKKKEEKKKKSLINGHDPPPLTLQRQKPDLIQWLRYQNTDEISRTGQQKTHRWLIKCSDNKVRNKILGLDGYNGFTVRLTCTSGMGSKFDLKMGGDSSIDVRRILNL